ncbi:MAG: hypothetical protein A2X49_02290 [Lentisphaerae bacterium GWF2_52_8]|nr:MAG: hypothetical protein A2X49_02290 [Lentisphaerae bacterium GWF2_52_8]
MQFFPSIDYGDPGPFFEECIRHLEQKYRMRLTVHDHRGLLFSREGIPFLPGRNMHTQDYCSTGRHKNSVWNRNCLKECAFAAESMALKKLRPFIHRCWKGCDELIVPIERNGELILILYAGVFRLAKELAPRQIPDGLKEKHRLLPAISKAELIDLSRVLLLLGQGMLCYAERYREDGRAPLNRKAIIRKFIDEHAHEPLKLAELARCLCISPSRAGHLVSELFGLSFQELVLEERMTRARNLLVSTSQPMKAIAQEVGLKNIFYFSRVFRGFYGMPPARYRAGLRRQSQLK